MKAAPEDQWKLLDLQVIDRNLAGLKHQLKTLPTATRLKEIKTALQETATELTVSATARKDLSRALKHAEDEVAKVQERAKTQRERLESGTLSPKEMERIQEELGLLAGRQGQLEDEALEAMDAVEQASENFLNLEKKQQALAAEQSALRESYAVEAAQVQEEINSALAAQVDLVAQIPSDLVAEYEDCKRTTGLGCVELRDGRAVGMMLELSGLESSRVRAAAPDEVLISEDHNLILVRK